jgi:hypothetical protein
VNQYIDGLERWVRANELWSFESPRYFGTQGHRVQKNREIYMLPRVEALSSRSLAPLADFDVEKDSVATMQILVHKWMVS